MRQETHTSGALARHLPTFLIVLMVIQPLMDILSFWTDRLGMSNTITLLLRFAVVCVLGFVTFSLKKVYGIAIAACAFLLVGHCISCFIVGYQRIVYDLTNFVRVVQMPLFVLCFISFLRANEKCYRAFETGLMLDFWIITASVVVSVLTHTSSATYQSTNVGILGWYSFGNAQSAIMSILAPIVILLCYRRKNFLLFTVTSITALAQLYLMGTRLAFFSIAVAALGVPVVLVLTGKARTSKRYIAVLVLALTGLNAFIVLATGILLSGLVGLFCGIPGADGQIVPYSLLRWGQDIYKGFTGMNEIMVLSMLIGGLGELIRYHGGIAWLLARVDGLARRLAGKSGGKGSSRVGESCIALLASLADICTANNTVAIILTGGLAREIALKNGIDPRRSASLLDIFSCVFQGLIPWAAQLLLAGSLAKISPLEITINNWYCMLLAVAGILAIILGLPRIKARSTEA